jgi:hypothetical protein
MADGLQIFGRIERHALYAVQLINPVTEEIVYSGARVAAVGLAHLPVVNRSGLFVWLEEGPAWPTRIQFEPGRLPFVKENLPALPRPSDPVLATEEQRRQRIRLRPTRAYPFDAGVTAIVGRLVERPDDNSPGIPDATVALAWRKDEHDTFHRPENQTSSPPVTDADGEFAVFLRLRASEIHPTDLPAGLLQVRLEFEVDGITRCTAPDFPFLDPPAPPGQVREGTRLAKSVRVPFSALE